MTIQKGSRVTFYEDEDNEYDGEVVEMTDVYTDSRGGQHGTVLVRFDDGGLEPMQVDDLEEN